MQVTFQTFIAPQSSTRSSISIHVQRDDKKLAKEWREASPSERLIRIDDVNEFKSTLQLFPRLPRKSLRQFYIKRKWNWELTNDFDYTASETEIKPTRKLDTTSVGMKATLDWVSRLQRSIEIVSADPCRCSVHKRFYFGNLKLFKLQKNFESFFRLLDTFLGYPILN